MQTQDKRRIGLGALAMTTVVALGLVTSALWPVDASAKGDGGTLTHSFQQASPQEVLAWLQKQGLEIRFNKADLPQTHLTFAFDGVQREQVVRELGNMIGMTTQKRGDVYSLMKGVGGDSPSEYLGSEGASGQDRGLFEGRVWEMPFFGGQDQKQELEKAQEKAFKYEGLPGKGFAYAMPGMGQDPQAIVDEVMKALEEAGVFQGKKFTDQQKQALREKLTAKLTEAHAKMQMMPFKGGMPEGFQWKEMPGGGKMFMLDPEHMKGLPSGEEYQKAMKEAQAAMEKALAEIRRSQAEQGQGLKGDELRKAIEQSQVALQKALEELRAGGKLKMLDEGELKKLHDEHMMFDNEAFKKSMEEMHKSLGEKMKVLRIKLENLKKFLATITPEQKALADKQGYLKTSDLTKEQRELLGIGEGGDVDMTFQVDDQKVTIKGKDKAEPKKGGGGVITA